jgi:hypothetical protein
LDAGAEYRIEEAGFAMEHTFQHSVV